MQNEDGTPLATQPQTTPDADSAGLQPCAKHPGEQTRLRCTHCETPICPKCMIQCEVGFKCKKCTSRSASHVVKAEARDYLAACILSVAVGYGFGYALEFGGFGWFMIILSFAAGRFLGQGVHHCARYKLADSLKVLMIVATAGGIMLSPAGQVMILLAESPEKTGIGMMLISCGAFLFGIAATFHNFRR